MLHRMCTLRSVSLVDRLDRRGIFQGAGHSLGRGGDAHVQRQDIIADGGATFQIYLPLLQCSSEASWLRPGSHSTYLLWCAGLQQA